MKTVKVRIAVAVGSLNEFYAIGTSWNDDEELARRASSFISGNPAIHYIEAEIPVPESVTVKGEVK